MLPARKYYKYIGLFLALVAPFALAAVRPGGFTVGGSVVKECLYWSLFAIFLLVVKYGEREAIAPLTNNGGLLRTALLSVAVTFSLLLAAIAYRLGYHMVVRSLPPHEAVMDKLVNYPVWLKAMMVIRAGVIEETFFRAYAMSRLQQLTGNKYIAFIVPLVLFSAGHYSYGTVNHILGALVLGIVLATFYSRTRNLLANIIGHTLFDALGLVAR